MKQCGCELGCSLAELNCVNNILKSALGQHSEYSSSSESLITLLNAGIERQSEGEFLSSQSAMDTATNTSEVQEKTDSDLLKIKKKLKKKHEIHLNAASDALVDKKRRKHKSTSHVDELVRQEIEVITVNEHKKKKKKHREFSEETANIKLSKDNSSKNTVHSTESFHGDKKQKKKKDVNCESIKHSKKIKILDNTVINEVKEKKKHKEEDKHPDNVDNSATIIDKQKTKKKKHKEQGKHSDNGNSSTKFNDDQSDVEGSKKYRKKHNIKVAANNSKIEPVVVDVIIKKKKKKIQQLLDFDEKSWDSAQNVITSKTDTLHLQEGEKHKKNKKPRLDSIFSVTEDSSSENDNKKKQKHTEPEPNKGFKSTSASYLIVTSTPKISDLKVKKDQKSTKNRPNNSTMPDSSIENEDTIKKKTKQKTKTCEENLQKSENQEALLKGQHKDLNLPKLQTKEGANISGQSDSLICETGKPPKIKKLQVEIRETDSDSCKENKVNLNASGSSKNMIHSASKEEVESPNLGITHDETKASEPTKSRAATSIYTTSEDESDIEVDESWDKSMEQNTLDPEDLKIVRHLHIHIPWLIPTSHLIETRMSSCPTKEQQEQFNALGTKMKTGPYTSAEDQIIRDNWTKFCETHDIPDNPKLFMNFTSQGKTALPPLERTNFVRFLGCNLAHRMLSSIYRRFKVLFKTFKKGKFTPEEDEIIRTFMKKTHVRNKYSVLGNMLGRPRESIITHYRSLRADREKIKWNLELKKNLIQNLMEVTGKNVVDELKDATITRLHWEGAEKLMGIPATKLRRKWLIHIYPRLFAHDFNTLNEVREKLINILYDNSENDRKQVNWNELALDFNGMTGSRLYKIFSDLVIVYVPNGLRKSFTDAVDYLKHYYLIERGTNTRNMKLSRLEYRKGELIQIDS